MPGQDSLIFASRAANQMGIADFDTLPTEVRCAAVAAAERCIDARREQNEGLEQELRGDLDSLLQPHAPEAKPWPGAFPGKH